MPSSPCGVSQTDSDNFCPYRPKNTGEVFAALKLSTDNSSSKYSGLLLFLVALSSNISLNIEEDGLHGGRYILEVNFITHSTSFSNSSMLVSLPMATAAGQLVDMFITFHRLQCPSCHEQNQNPRIFSHFSLAYLSCDRVRGLGLRCLNSKRRYWNLLRWLHYLIDLVVDNLF